MNRRNPRGIDLLIVSRHDAPETGQFGSSVQSRKGVTCRAGGLSELNGGASAQLTTPRGRGVPRWPGRARPSRTNRRGSVEGAMARPSRVGHAPTCRSPLRIEDVPARLGSTGPDARIRWPLTLHRSISVSRSPPTRAGGRRLRRRCPSGSTRIDAGCPGRHAWP